MKIDAKITKTFPTGNVKAIADVTLDDSIAVHGVKLIDGKNGTFISMPSDRWQDKDGNFKHVDIVHPTNADTRSALFHAVQDAFNAFVQSTGQAQTGIAM